MKFLKSIFVFLFLTNLLFGADFGIYEKVVQNAAGNAQEVADLITQNLTESSFQYLNTLKMSTPNLVREDAAKHSTFNSFLILATDTAFDKFQAQFGKRYAANWILRIGVYEDETGVQVVIANPITLTRIICNDLDDANYQKVIAKSEEIRQNLRSFILSAVKGKEVSIQMPPLRSAERLRKAKKDMMMMVGPMTFFRDKDQFPILLSIDTGADPATKLQEVIDQVKKNIEAFQPAEKDAGYHWTKSAAEDLKWRVVCEVKNEGINAALLGITRNRTEALSFHICGMKRETEANSTPGIDHVCAYPVEVAIFEEDGKIKVGTPREMFRMDMFFWDAGKWAFMKFMNMPGNLDKSIKKAITGRSK
ncbi:MAG: hypothetical protein GXO74_16335 [Calditrichaeota bacterium]|nr:hypothetical protein [Calditrichota bacterium]